MLGDAIERLHDLDATIDGAAVVRALARDLHGDPSVLAARTDPAIAALAVELVDTVVQPRSLTGAGRPSPAALRRATRCRQSFAEGYLLGRIGLDIHGLAVLWSGPDVDGARAALRRLTLSAPLTRAYERTRRVAPLVTEWADQTRAVPTELATQFAALGLLAAVAEWTVVVGGHGPRSRLALAGC